MLSGRKLVKFLYTHQSTKLFENTIQKIREHKKHHQFTIDEIYVFLILFAPRIIKEQNGDLSFPKEIDIVNILNHQNSHPVKKRLTNIFVDLLSKAPKLTHKNFEVPVFLPFLHIPKAPIRKLRNPIKYIIIDEYGSYLHSLNLSSIASTMKSMRSRSTKVFIPNAIPKKLPEIKLLSHFYHNYSIYNTTKKASNFFPPLKSHIHPLLKGVKKLCLINHNFSIGKHGETILHKIIPYSSSHLNIRNKNYLLSNQRIGDLICFTSHSFKPLYNAHIALNHFISLVKRCNDSKSALFLLQYIFNNKDTIRNFFHSICEKENLVSRVFANNHNLFQKLSKEDFQIWITNNRTSYNENNRETIEKLFSLQNISNYQTDVLSHIQALRVQDIFFNLENFSYLQEGLQNANVAYKDAISLIQQNEKLQHMFDNDSFIFSLLLTYHNDELLNKISIPEVSESLYQFSDNIDTYLKDETSFIYSELLEILILHNYWKPSLEQLRFIKEKFKKLEGEESLFTKSPNKEIREKISLFDTLILEEELELSIPHQEAHQKINKF